ncbi:ABC transporter ATP-binding protein [Verrucosispora sp. WMMD573]|uniref:ABC transporter ATP-binding protein n=1 Tax=Verrucosispora sp. WMMD573 TaxID=3015149 RepID=UPI00248C3478|nr:ABC transporter ATP-binding protein [Verrucosispora sp. WMMD573]WBB53630.1 ABC transporter ATP-binding protein [Verrucosispora sp. WMMD573]
MTVLVDVRDLSVRFRLPRGTAVRAVTGASFQLRAGRCLALVGESGCGKSVLVGSLLGLLPGNAEVAGTAVLTDGVSQVDLLTAPEPVLSRRIRGRRIGLVPQSPAAHLTPVHTVRRHLTETLGTLRPKTGRTMPRQRRRAADQAAVEAGARVGLPATALAHYPHELSGGMAQRAVTALALAGDPEVLLADEPTTGLDASLARRTLDELRQLVDLGHAVLLITHDLDAAARIADDVAVMYASRIVETGPVEAVLHRPRHPYTAGLLAALPRNGFHPIPGLPPQLDSLPGGCAFESRCQRAGAECAQAPPATADGGHLVACHRPC